MAIKADVGTAVTVAHGTTTFAWEMTSVSHTGVSRPAIDVSHLGTTTERVFKPGDLVDYGEIQVEGHYDPSQDDTPADVMTASPETITVTLPLQSGDGTAANIVFTGFWTAFESSFPLEDKMTFSGTIKVEGDASATTFGVAGP